MENVTRVSMFDKNDAIKQMIYIPIDTDCNSNERNLSIMRVVTQSLGSENEFFRFDPTRILGAENVKNAEHLWCDFKSNLWQVCCGRTKDMHNNDISNCWNVMVLGTWFSFD